MIYVNNELKTILESVLNEALEPIREELHSLNERVGSIENELQEVQSQMNTRLNTLETKTAHIQESVSDIIVSIAWNTTNHKKV